MKMTKKQAIKTLKSLLLNIAGEKDCQAIQLAIAALQSDPNAPDWSQAPEWARWYAIDSILLKGYWYENKPIYDDQNYIPKSGKYERDINANFPTLFKRSDQ